MRTLNLEDLARVMHVPALDGKVATATAFCRHRDAASWFKTLPTRTRNRFPKRGYAQPSRPAAMNCSTDSLYTSIPRPPGIRLKRNVPA